MTSRLSLFLGKPYVFEGVQFHSPTVNEVEELSEGMYYTYQAFASFDLKTILIQLFQKTEAEYESYAEQHPFELMTSQPSLNKYMCESLTFFAKCPVHFHDEDFYCDKVPFLNARNYVQFISFIRELNGIKQEKKETSFKNEKSKFMFDKLEKLRKKHKKNDDQGLELKDILSILCIAEGNGISVFNVGELTIYQVYSLFEHLNLKENHRRTLPVWANGHLKENEKLPEWILKTSL